MQVIIGYKANTRKNVYMGEAVVPEFGCTLLGEERMGSSWKTKTHYVH